MKHISILIPTFNDACYDLVETLQHQAATLDINYEIIVADDGSTDMGAITANRAINTLPCCRVIERQQNSGRAAIRNFLAQQSQYPWLLFIDSDMVIPRPDFLLRYADADGDTVIDGGIVVGKGREDNLRYLYERAAEHEHTASQRVLSPYQDFHTANFMIRRDLMLRYPFDQRFRHYGYEDVLLGKTLEREGIPVSHIDNPTSFEVYEDNSHFLDKTEEGLRTLYTFRQELKGYSRMIDKADRLPHLPILLWHRLFAKWERHHLAGSHPLLFFFHLYRLGYFISLYHS